VGARVTAQLTGVIVAGGTASRLGGIAKGLAEVGGLRIVDRVSSALASVSDSIVVATNATDAAQWVAGARIVPDILEGGGAAAGIHAALTACRSPVIAVAWDMPFVRPALMAKIASYADPTRYDAVVPAGDEPDSLEPLCAWYAPSVAPAISARWSTGRRGLHDLLSDLRTYIVPRDVIATIGRPKRLFFNVNTPEDLEAARAMADE
jgi:molybdopterin-guanine dinucleotide biosynthesis protein A